MTFLDTNPAFGDNDYILLAKIAQSLGVLVQSGDTPNIIFTKIAQAAAAASGGGGDDDSAYVLKAGDTMTGNLVAPNITATSVLTAPAVVGSTSVGAPAINGTTSLTTPLVILGTTVKFTASGDGILKVTDVAGTSFARIQLGGTTSSFPAIKRNSAAINFRLADDSADAAITSAGITSSGTVSGSAVTATNALTGATLVLGTTVNFAASSDGVLKITDAAGTSFGRIQFGGTTSSFPALKRSSAILQTRLADDSAFTVLEVQNLLITPVAVTYAATTDLDMSSTGIRTLALTGNVTFTTSNKAAGRSVTVKILADSSSRTLTFPAWIFVGAAAPTTLAANKTAMLTVTCFDTTDANCVAAYAAQP